MKRGSPGLLTLAAAPLIALAVLSPASAASHGPGAAPRPRTGQQWQHSQYGQYRLARRHPASGVLLGPAAPGRMAGTTPRLLSTAPPVATALAGFVDTGDPRGNYNSSGGTVTVRTRGTGVYEVTFAGLAGITGGNAQLTTQGQATCSIGGWQPMPLQAPTDLDVDVSCYRYTGQPASAGFTLLVAQPRKTPHGLLAYDSVLSPGKSQQLTGPYQYNSTHQPNHLTRLGPGRHREGQRARQRPR
jgi:hypothetical protein